MWALTLLYILGLNIYQATGQENSTKMHYIRLKIESSAIPNITKILKPFVNDPALRVDDLQITTTCQNVSGSDSQLSCSCETGHRWSDEVCQSNPDCCDGTTCTFLKNSNHMCVSNSTVTISGSLILPRQKYFNCLAEKHKEIFQNCHSSVTEKMKEEYSKLRGFHSLTVGQYRSGSVKADFQLIFAQSINSEALFQKSLNLSKTLPSSFTMETKGFVHLSMPTNPVHYNSQDKLTCTVPQDLKTEPAWSLSRGKENTKITNGTQAQVKTLPLETNIELYTISELWAGEYTCLYSKKINTTTISHKASGVMDVCLKPNIHIVTSPSFPHCQSDLDTRTVEVRCETGSSDESYTVVWSGEHHIVPGPAGETGVFKRTIVVSCDPNEPLPPITCTLTNRCNQSTDASMNINIIYAEDKFCEEDGDWEKTKAGFTAYLQCKNQAGTRQRKCNSQNDTEWEAEVSDCVNQEVSNVQQKATIVDIGLGSVNDNAATVFSLLENVTNNTQTIDTFPNLNTTVNVLVTLSQKLSHQQNSVVDNLLGSSSNLLDRSLNRSWSTNLSNDNRSMAERYLSSVEHLINVTNITQRYRKKNLEVEERSCSKTSPCSNKVLNNTVNLKDLKENPGSVKTTGFQELVRYLPNNFENYDPNSIVVSTTTERNVSNSVTVEINFQLLQQRPRNFEMICVSWDFEAKSWSKYKCEWRWGADSDGVCVCEHLSSFAILMGKQPLEVKWLTEITYAGLSVSVLSLVITLIIEMVIWSNTVKTNTSYLRHAAHINICLCLLVADCAFLASSRPPSSQIWCRTLVVLKHFCYLAMFFWMLWLSSTLLHQTVFLFHNVSKKNYLKLSVFLGYVCPLMIVTITFIANKAGAEGHYYSKDTCWLVYKGLLKGSIYTFIIPIGTIVFFNIFSMLVVIMKLLDHPKTAASAGDKEKKSALVVIRAIVLLTPIFGVTWIFGFAVMILDLNYGVIAHIANYVFTLLNSFQGFFILLTVCLGDTTTREELRNRLKRKATKTAKDSLTDSTTTK